MDALVPILSLSGALTLALVSRHLWVGLLLLAPFLVLAPWEVWFASTYGRASDAHLLGILADTHWDEAREYLGAAVFGVTALLVASIALAGAAVVVAWRRRWQWQGRARRWLWAASVAALLLPWLALQAGPAPPADLSLPAPGGSDLGDDIAERGLDPLLTPLAQSYPLGVVLRAWEFWRYRQVLGRLDQHLAGFRFNARLRTATPAAVSPWPSASASISASSPQRQVHVLVIGETGRPDRWQLNGYARATTPQLSAMPDVVSFTNMISPWAWTRMSVPVMITRKPATDPRPFFAERSLVAAFREAGFRTYWLSTQSPLGPHDSSIALHANEAHEVRFINPQSYQGDAALDGDLLAPMAGILARGEPRQLIVLHTLGSHYNYSHRVPAAFERFTPSLRQVAAPNLRDRTQREAMNNAYDNAALYTDHILASAITLLRQQATEATLMYAADHGENLFDGACNKSGHGHHTERDHRIAALFWASPQWAQAHPQRLAHARARAAAPLSTTHLFHSLLDAADIAIDGEDLRSSLFSAAWQPQPRPVQSGLDFDTALRESPCLELKPRPPSAF